MSSSEPPSVFLMMSGAFSAVGDGMRISKKRSGPKRLVSLQPWSNRSGFMSSRNRGPDLLGLNSSAADITTVFPLLSKFDKAAANASAEGRSGNDFPRKTSSCTRLFQMPTISEVAHLGSYLRLSSSKSTLQWRQI